MEASRAAARLPAGTLGHHRGDYWLRLCVICAALVSATHQPDPVARPVPGRAAAADQVERDGPEEAAVIQTLQAAAVGDHETAEKAVADSFGEYTHGTQIARCRMLAVLHYGSTSRGRRCESATLHVGGAIEQSPAEAAGPKAG